MYSQFTIPCSARQYLLEAERDARTRIAEAEDAGGGIPIAEIQAFLNCQGKRLLHEDLCVRCAAMVAA